MSEKSRVFSGAQPTGRIHIGNYIGALSLWAENQEKYDNIFCVVDLHAMTIPESINPDVFRKRIKETAALYLACGIDPNLSTIFVQSHVPAHAELTWILNCMTPMGWLERMTQYKSKSEKVETIGTGLFDYPVLMASDILLYQTDLVPVGDDQKQHIEITRDIAQRFNSMFGEAFKMPKELIRESGARIMGLDDPSSKMSKSTGEQREGHAIWLMDSPDSIKKSIMRAVTDTESETRYQHASAGVQNLLTLYQVFTNKTMEEIDEHFGGKGYGFLKKELVEVVVESLKPIQTKYNQLIADEVYINEILKDGRDKVAPIAEKTLKRVKELVGLL